MLVLSRKKNESIVVDGAIVITVVEIRGDKVRLGIEAPREIAIHRSEVHAAIQAQLAAEGDHPPPAVTPGLEAANDAVLETRIAGEAAEQPSV